MKRIISFVVSLLVMVGANAQDYKTGFDEYRAGLLTRQQEFRKKILDDYDKYLEGIWKEYEAFAGKKRDIKPKPTVLPKAEDKPTAPVDVPNPDKPVKPQEPTPTKPVPTAPVAPPAPVIPAAPTSAPVTFSFYGMTWKAPAVKVSKVAGADGKNFADAWRGYSGNGCKDVIPTLKTMASAHGLNDWFTFQMVRSYADAVAKDGSNADRVVLQHFLLVNMGYDVRLARNENQMLLLVPVEQQMYSRSYLDINGKNYYVFHDEMDGEKEATRLYTCDLPSDADCGKSLSLLYAHGAKVTEGESKAKTLTDGKLTVKGEVNVKLMEMLRHYPQMDIPNYASSNILPPLHKSIIDQLRPQIAGLSQRDAANRLLSFLQHCFSYATDGEQHGYEKAYFLEENFYYPKNDCEDRAIFYAFLVRNLLNLDVHLVHFPGHECTAVRFTDSSISGDGYMYDGNRYIICDPTYIGASIGMCMPDYRGVKPEVELW